MELASSRPAAARIRAGLPREVLDAFRPGLPSLADEIIAAIRREVGPYARPLTGEFGRGVRVGVERALTRFLEMVEDPSRPSPAARRVYVELGRGEFREDRSLDSLLAAYRVGARVAWRRVAEAGSAAGLPPETLFDLGEAIFAYIDELSSASAEGYAQEQSAAAGERERRRRELVSALLAEPPVSEQALRPAADSAGWRLPATVAAVVAPGERPGELSSVLGRDAVAAVVVPGETVGFLGDPVGPGVRDRLERALVGRGAVVGPPASLHRAAWSAAVARRASQALRHGQLPGAVLGAEPKGRPGTARDGRPVPRPLAETRDPVFCADHLLDLTLAADPLLAAELAERTLAPLGELPARTRDRLRTTLGTWLEAQGGIEATASALGVHPQTVRYRLGQLRECLGDALDTPEGRLALQVSLRVEERPEPAA